MKNKNLIYLGAAVVVLFGLYCLLQIGNVPKAEIMMLVETDTSMVTEVSIYKDGATTTLTRGEKGWNITNPYEYPANNSFIKTLLKKLDDLRIESTVTTNAKRWAEFELDDGKATKVTIVQGDVQSDFYIGKSASGYKQTYARLEGKDEVLLIRGTYGVAVNRKPESWREKKVADFAEEEVIKVTTHLLEMVKDGEDWRVTTKGGESFVADQSKAGRVPRSLKNLRTSDFPEPADYEGVNWDKPYREVTVGLSTGDTRSIRFYEDPNEENRYFMRYHNTEHVFRVYKGVIGQIFKEADDLKAKPKEEENIQ
ncbi:MAG: DUF4340 domain-containing protein [Candidatus Electryonea clarkiae]|nr:DUF4340 domain-containing protein [Candidatus Electryonea clarkiae]